MESPLSTTPSAPNRNDLLAAAQVIRDQGAKLAGSKTSPTAEQALPVVNAALTLLVSVALDLNRIANSCSAGRI